jgi:quinol monooxygenase YgiN
MSVRLIVTLTALPGRGREYADAWKDRLAEVNSEVGCEQYEMFVSTTRPDTVVLLERWTSEDTLAAHSALMRTKAPVAPELRAESKVERFAVASD